MTTTLKVAATSALNAATKAADDLPELQAALAAVDPRLAASMSTKALILSKTPWVVSGAGLLAAIATKYGLPLPADVANDIVVGITLLVTLISSYVMRYRSTSYISGIVKVPGTTVPAVVAPTTPAA